MNENARVYNRFVKSARSVCGEVGEYSWLVDNKTARDQATIQHC